MMDYQSAQRTYSTAAAGAPIMNPAAPEPLGQRVSGIQERLNAAEEALAQIEAKLFGPVPAQLKAATAEGMPGLNGAVLACRNHAEDIAERLRKIAAEL